MIHKSKLTLSFLFLVVAVYAQDRTKPFILEPPTVTLSHSQYRTIAFLDSRADTNDMGSIQKGVLNVRARVVADPPLTIQLSNMLSTLIDSTAGDGKLLFQLRHLQFAELTGAFSENGHSYMRASLYAGRDGHYIPLATIDTVVSVASIDVTNALLRRAGNTITDFIAINLSKQPATATGFRWDEVTSMDSIEKRRIPIYNTETYTEGLYLTYASFAAQTPDQQGEIHQKDGLINQVKATDAAGKDRRVRPKDLYAIVYNGQPYIATDYGYYPLKREQDDFLFTGKAKVTAAAGDVIVASAFFGIAGTLIASNADAIFEMKIDHLNGGFIRICEVP